MSDTKPILKIVGRSGNAFSLLGACRDAARKVGWTRERIDAFVAEAKSGDYDALLATCNKYFDIR